MVANDNTGKRGRGPTDPTRRQRITLAAIAVVAEGGVAAVTHRAVAATAGVPLGSTTYHFATLDDLLAAALRTAAEHNVAKLREWERSLAPGADLATALADLVTYALTDDRAQTVVEYELYVAALHRPRLRAASTAWDNAVTELFAARTDPNTGRLLAAAFCGLLMQALLADPPPTREELTAFFRRSLHGTSPAPNRVDPRLSGVTTTRAILLLCGSLRSGSTNAALLRTARALAPAGFAAVAYDGMGALPHFNPDDDHDRPHPAVVDLRTRIDRAAAILICTPEYAGALPGAFKNLLDWTVGGVEIGNKPTAWINVSASGTRAADAHASLRKVLEYTGATIVEDACAHLPVHGSTIDDEGLVADQKVRDGVVTSLAVLAAAVS